MPKPVPHACSDTTATTSRQDNRQAGSTLQRLWPHRLGLVSAVPANMSHAYRMHGQAGSVLLEAVQVIHTGIFTWWLPSFNQQPLHPWSAPFNDAPTQQLCSLAWPCGCAQAFFAGRSVGSFLTRGPPGAALIKIVQRLSARRSHALIEGSVNGNGEAFGRLSCQWWVVCQALGISLPEVGKDSMCCPVRCSHQVHSNLQAVNRAGWQQ